MKNRIFQDIRKSIFLPLTAVAALFIIIQTPQAWGQSNDMQSLLNRLDRLERDIRTLNTQLARGGSSTGGASLKPYSSKAIVKMEVRLSNLDDELRAATGKAEEVSFQLEQINQRLDKLIADVDYRLSALESTKAGGQPRLSAAPSPPAVQTVIPGASEKASEGAAFATQPSTLGTITESDLKGVKKPDDKKRASEKLSQAALPQAADDGPKTTPGALPQGTPKEQYTYAFGLLRQSNYDKAEVALSEFLTLHADDPLASNARYWLGETYYVREDFRTAAQIFIEGYKKSPKSAKAIATLLKLGMSLAKLDKKSEACAAFDKLSSDFPKVPANISKLLTKERKNNGCN